MKTRAEVRAALLAVACPHCRAAAGEPCQSRTRRGRPLGRGVHPARRRAAAEELDRARGPEPLKDVTGCDV